MPKMHNVDLKIAAIKKLGGKCSLCGYSDWRALQFDHVVGGGSNQSSNDKSYYTRIINDTSGDFQLLCSNCNTVKRYTNGEGVSKEMNEFLVLAMRLNEGPLEVSLC